MSEQVETAWRCVSMHDLDERRGVWYRRVGDTLEVRGGRWGEDGKFIARGNDANQLEHVLSYGAWVQEEYGPNTSIMPFKSYNAGEQDMLISEDEIEIVFEHDAIWGYDPSTWDGIDRVASEDKLVDDCFDALVQSGLPNSYVTIKSSGGTRESDYLPEYEQLALKIANDVWDKHEWYVIEEKEQGE